MTNTDMHAEIAAIRAIATKALVRYEHVENGWDPVTMAEIGTSADVERIQDEIALELAEKDIYLIYRIGQEFAWDPDTMARTDGTGANDRLVCLPAAYWSSRAYGPIVVVRASTIAA